MTVYIINNPDEFHNYFTSLKESARSGSVPDTFMIGFDIEFICQANHPQSFNSAHRWITHLNSQIAVCTIQLATNDFCLVILLPSFPYLPKKLLQIITNSCWIKLGVGIDMDLSHLSSNYNLGHCGGGIDLRNLALLAHIKHPNLENLYNRLLHDHLRKNSHISSTLDWSKPLSEKQLTYAAQDAIISYRLGSAILQPSIDNLKKNINDVDKLAVTFANLHLNNNVIISNNNNNKPNYIGKLNEFAQTHRLSMPTYTSSILDNKQFECTCIFNNHQSRGTGNSKKIAKHNSAHHMVQLLNIS